VFDEVSKRRDGDISGGDEGEGHGRVKSE
jgi:hypothetical protein